MKWRMVTGVVLLMILLVLAVQPVAACHPVLDGNCDDIWVDVVAGTGTLNVTVDGNQVFNGPAQDGDHFQWSFEELNLEPCLVHNVVASYGGVTDTTNVGGLSCCEARLNISHVLCEETCPPKVEVHFRLVHLPSGVTDYGAISYTMTMPDGTIHSGTATFDGVTGDGAHYYEHIDMIGSGSGAYNVTSGSVTLTFAGGETLVIDLANPQVIEVTNCECPPPEVPHCLGATGNPGSGEITYNYTITGVNIEDPDDQVIAFRIDWWNGSESVTDPVGATRLVDTVGTHTITIGLETIDYGTVYDNACQLQTVASEPGHTLASTSSASCNQETGFWTVERCLENTSDVRSYDITQFLGAKTQSGILGPKETMCLSSVVIKDTISFMTLVGGKVFEYGTDGPFGPCGEVFVPEWSTLTLLGGGLSSLAGYAKLRRRLHTK